MEIIVTGDELNKLNKNCVIHIPKPQTNEKYIRSCTFEELAGTIYEWHSAGYTKGRLGLGLNPITDIVEWLKQPHKDTK